MQAVRWVWDDGILLPRKKNAKCFSSLFFCVVDANVIKKKTLDNIPNILLMIWITHANSLSIRDTRSAAVAADFMTVSKCKQKGVNYCWLSDRSTRIDRNQRCHQCKLEADPNTAPPSSNNTPPSAAPSSSNNSGKAFLSSSSLHQLTTPRTLYLKLKFTEYKGVLTS